MPEKDHAVELTPREAIAQYTRATQVNPNDADSFIE